MICKNCQTDKPESEFPKSLWRCKSCVRTYQQNYRLSKGQKFKQGLPFGDITGLKQGDLEVVKFVENREQTSWWLCRCKCGIEKIIPRYSLVPSSKLQSCGCSRSKVPTGSQNKRWTGSGEMSGSYWRNITNGAKHRNLPVTITKEEAWQLFLEQERKCALSDLPLKFPSKEKARDGTASLDRIDSNKGYTSDNVQWIHKDINRMKMDMSENEFIRLCKLIISKNKGID